MLKYGMWWPFLNVLYDMRACLLGEAILVLYCYPFFVLLRSSSPQVGLKSWGSHVSPSNLGEEEGSFMKIYHCQKCLQCTLGQTSSKKCCDDCNQI